MLVFIDTDPFFVEISGVQMNVPQWATCIEKYVNCDDDGTCSYKNQDISGFVFYRQIQKCFFTEFEMIEVGEIPKESIGP